MAAFRKVVDGAPTPCDRAWMPPSMSVKQPSADNDTEAQNLPGGWELTDAKGVDYRAIEAFAHAETGQVVLVRRQRRPTQLHTPETSDTDTGYRTLVQDDDDVAPLSFALSAETVARSDAREFMDEYPEGDFDVGAAETPMGEGPVEW